MDEFGILFLIGIMICVLIMWWLIRHYMSKSGKTIRNAGYNRNNSYKRNTGYNRNIRTQNMNIITRTRYIESRNLNHCESGVPAYGWNSTYVDDVLALNDNGVHKGGDTDCDNRVDTGECCDTRDAGRCCDTVAGDTGGGCDTGGDNFNSADTDEWLENDDTGGCCDTADTGGGCDTGDSGGGFDSGGGDTGVCDSGGGGSDD